MSDEPKFCKDCAHFIRGEIYDRCSAPGALNRVTGDPGYAMLERGYDLQSSCGPEARWFIPAPPKPARRWWEFWR